MNTRPRLGLDYGLHPLNVDANVLEVTKFVKDNKIILVYVEHGSSNVDSSIFVTPKKGVAIAVDNHLRKTLIEIDNKVVGPIGNFKGVEVDIDNKTKEESDTEENDTSSSDSEYLNYDSKHDDENILEDVHVSMNSFNFNPDPKHDLSIVVVEVYEHDLVIIDYDSFGSDLDDGIDYERRTQLR
nr:GAF domain-containing protein [Tanacetum cinerariifolium]